MHLIAASKQEYGTGEEEDKEEEDKEEEEWEEEKGEEEEREEEKLLAFTKCQLKFIYIYNNLYLKFILLLEIKGKKS